MLGGIEAPTEFEAVDHTVNLSKAEKLKIIADTPIEASLDQGSYVLKLPFHASLRCLPLVGSSENADNLHIESINLKDHSLLKQGIGSRLVKAAVRLGVEDNPDLEVFSAMAAQLGCLNTAVKVVGEENVRIEHGTMTFGNGSDQPLASVFDYFPAEKDQPYVIDYLEAKIDRLAVKQWELPVVSLNCNRS